MDRFFTQKYCDRCGGTLEGGRIMSMYNNDCICIKCKDAETKRADYKEALEADRAESRAVPPLQEDDAGPPRVQALRLL